MRVYPSSLLRWWMSGLWLLGLLLPMGILPTAARAQGQIGTLQGLSRAFDETRDRRMKLMAGEEPNAADKKVAAAAAQWYLYRISFKSSDHAKTQRDFYEVVDHLVTAEKAKTKNQRFMHLFGGELVNSMKTVLAVDLNENPTTIINACMMLPTMGRLRQDNVGEYLMSLVNSDTTHDVIRLYALKALRECMPIRIQPEEEDFDINKALLAKKNLEVKYVDTLRAYIDRPIKTSEMRGEEIAVVHYLRREAITALAQAGAPAVMLARKGGKLEGDVASSLLKVLAPSALEPPSTLQEKIEAAMGLCALRYPNMPEYNAEVAIYLIGQMIVEMERKYNEDLGQLVADKTAKRLPRIAWKVESKRLLEIGLRDLVNNTRDDGSRKKAEDLRKAAMPVLLSMAQYAPPNRELVIALKNFVAQNLLPKSGAAFKTPNAVVIPLN